MSVAAQRHWLTVRAVPRVSPVQVIAVTAIVGIAIVAATDDASTAANRLRLVAACIAATVGFVLDDEAATTLAGVPATRLARRCARVLVGVALASVGYAAAALVAAGRSGVGAPSPGAISEFAAVGACALAASAFALGRSDDGRGGPFGGVVAIVLYSSVYLPARWWVPLTPLPEPRRLILIAAVAAGLLLLDATDPAVRARRGWRPR